MAKADRFEGLDADKVTDNTKLTAMSASFAESKHLDLDIYPAERAMLYKLQKMNDEIKELHRYLGSEVTSNTVTNLSTTVDGTSLTINSSDGTNASIPAATNTAWGALTDNNDGLEFYRKLSSDLPYILNSNGLGIFEVGLGHHPKDAKRIFSKIGRSIELLKDYNGDDRLLIVKL